MTCTSCRDGGRIFTGSRMLVLYVAAVCVFAAACQPTVQVEAPEKPIVINLNVKIEHEVRVKVDRELDDLIEEQPELF